MSGDLHFRRVPALTLIGRSQTVHNCPSLGRRSLPARKCIVNERGEECGGRSMRQCWRRGFDLAIKPLFILLDFDWWGDGIVERREGEIGKFQR